MPKQTNLIEHLSKEDENSSEVKTIAQTDQVDDTDEDELDQDKFDQFSKQALLEGLTILVPN